MVDVHRDFEMIINPYITDKFIIFSRQKMASSYLRAMWSKKYNQTNVNNLPWVMLNPFESFNLINKFNEPECTIPPVNEYYDLIRTDFNNISKKVNKKDIIILIRNPKVMFLSAWYQDYITPIIYDDGNMNNAFYNILSILQNDDDINDNIINSFINTVKINRYDRDGMNGFFNSSQFGSNHLIIHSIIKSRIKVLKYLNESVISEHNQFYLSKYNEFITSPYIDNSKIKIIDLDNKKTPLTKLLNSYNCEEFSDIKDNESYGWKEAIDECFALHENYRYYESLMNEMDTEFFYYNKLINLPNYIKVLT